MITRIARTMSFLISATAAAAMFAGLSAWFMSRLDPAQQEIISLAHARRLPNDAAVRTHAGRTPQARRASPTPDQAQIEATFSGEFVDGAPVYRLPSIAVIANRKAELARIEPQEYLSRARQVPAKVAGRPPA